MIEIRNLGKQYKLAASPSYISLRETITGSVKNIFSNTSNGNETFWALRDINLDIEAGERVGIIGRNGAGKSTLLKIISRITPPTTGNARLRGRVGSLLEVGTGFHPELTGRENIYLNGSILGLKKAEINRQLDAIIDFSAVQKFIDAPLKHYSSGMQLRLAFAVAAHLDPEILLIDEVLAVGDAEFQQKCISKMDEVSRQQGRTILFVSHQLNAVQKLCTKAIWLEKGQLQFAGKVDETIRRYMQSVQSAQASHSWKRETIGDSTVFVSAVIANPSINIGDDLVVDITISDMFKGRHLIININLYNELGEFISHILNEDDGFSTERLAGNNLEVTLRSLNLLPGKYSLSFWAGLDMIHGLDKITQVVHFEVGEQNHFTKRVAAFPSHSQMIIRSEWKAR